MSLQKLAAQRIKRNMRLYINAVKKRRWLALNTSNGIAVRKGSLHQAGVSYHEHGASRSMSVASVAPNTPELIGGQSKSRRSSNTTNSDHSEHVPPPPPVQEKSFIAKYFGSSSSSTSTTTVRSNSIQNGSSLEHFSSPVKDTISHDNMTNRSSQSQVTIQSSKPIHSDVMSPGLTRSTEHHLDEQLSAKETLDADTRFKLETVALALKEAKDAGLSIDSSPAMQMSINLLASHGYQYVVVVLYVCCCALLLLLYAS